MDEWTLNDLLECSVCLERLDTSSKVLPCQHTFCRKCLEEIVSTHKELRCPECRVLVDAQIDELPPNVLLMRILEGIKNSGNPVPKKKLVSIQKQQQQGVQINAPQGPAGHNHFENSKLQPAQKENTQSTQPYARAIYDYASKEPGDLSFRKGEIILLHRKVNAQWLQGECGGKTGIFPLTYVQVIVPLPNQVATCRALYDFRMVNDEDEGCLSFHKDEVITVIRRVDENWAEGKLNDRFGIFPLAFVEMNNVAQALMKLSINSQPGPSRVAPPTPNAEETTPLIPTDNTAVISNCVNLHPFNQTNATQQNSTTKPPVTVAVCGSESGSTLSSTSTPSSSSITPNHSSSNTSSSSNSAPNSPPSSQPPPANPNPFLPTSPGPLQMILQTSHIASSPHGVLPTSHIVGQSPQPQPQPQPQQQQQTADQTTFSETHCLWTPAQPSGGDVANFSQHPKDKRHSFGAVTSSQPNSSNSNKRTGDVGNSDPVSDGQNGQLIWHGSKSHKRSGSDLSSGVVLPASYLALYPYKPQKADELELKKGSLYLVTDRCQDGWFKGTSYKTQKSGVFPGNYVTPAKPVVAAPGLRIRDARVSSPAFQPTQFKTIHQSKNLRVVQKGQSYPPELPPRASSPSARHPRNSGQNSQASWQVQTASDVSGTQKNLVVEGATTVSHPTSTPAASSNGKSSSPGYAMGLSSASSTPTKSAEKVKEKKEKSGLIKRLTGMKRSKSPTESASYSMDNPVFDDAPAASYQSQPHGHPVHLRSGSCPSQLLQVKLDVGTNPRVSGFASVSGRPKVRDRPSIGSVNFTTNLSRPLEANTVAKVGFPGATSHRKSNSLDAADIRKPKKLLPPVRERFRCIVPYPPNSEYELELKVGDIIYVHRKREDGWYKGTQQRTGKVGLFPGSFVETC